MRSRFIENKIAICCYNKKQWNSLIDFLTTENLIKDKKTWENFAIAHDLPLCVAEGFMSGVGFANPEFYIKEGWEVVNFDDFFAEELTMPSESALLDFLNAKGETHV